MGKSKRSNVRVLVGYNDPSSQKDQRSQEPIPAKAKEEAPSHQEDLHSKAQEADQGAFKVKLSSMPKEDPGTAAKALGASWCHPVNQTSVEVDLGLDISTSITGVVMLEKKTGALHFLGHVPLTSTKLVTLFDKADAVIDWIKQNLPRNVKVSRIFVEANAKGYSMGFSSADTLFTLAKMNALVSYLTHKWYNVPVLDINVTSARSKIGYKNNKNDKRPVKEKVREFVLLNNAHLPFKTRTVQVGKKKGSIVPAMGVEDEIDAFVVCRGGQLLNP